jgi:hypothetical protein
LYDLAIRFGDIHAIKYVEPESVLHYVKNYIVQYPELAQYLSGYSEYVVMNVIMDNKAAVEFLPDDLKKSFSQKEELIRIRNSLTKFENSNENNLEILKGFSAIKKELMMLTNHNDKNQLLEI